MKSEAEQRTAADLKLLACAFEKLPKPIQDAHLTRPALITEVEPDGDGFRLMRPAGFLGPAPQALVPKLGIKTWRDAGGLGVIYAGVAMVALLKPLLLAPSGAQRVMARSWARTGTPLPLYLLPYLDFSDISEIRFLAHAGSCRRISACLRGNSAAGFDARISRISRLGQAAKQCAALLGGGSWILDLALLPDDRIRIVEVNPALSPVELAALGVSQVRGSDNHRGG